MVVDSLAYGLTHYFVMKCIGEQGAMSGFSNLAEVTLPVDFDVAIRDTGLESALREHLDKPSGPLRYAELVTMTEFDASDRGVVDLTGLQYCENSIFLGINDNAIVDLSPLRDLSKLWAISAAQNNISDVSPLATITSLGQLSLGQNNITDVSSLAGLTGLSVFRINGNAVVDISAVQDMTELEWLDLKNNQVTDLSPVVANSGLGEGDRVDLYGNPLSETSITTHIPALEARGVIVNY